MTTAVEFHGRSRSESHRPTSIVRRRPLTVFLVSVAVMVLPANLVAGALGANAQHVDRAPAAAQVALYAQALIPALAALLAWRVCRLRREWGFRRARRGMLLTAWTVAVLAIVVGYGVAWSTGAAEFSAAGIRAAWGGVPAWAGVLIGLLLGVLPWMALAIGEELGWNSFLTVRLAPRWGADRTALLVGFAWAAFHVPLMIFVAGAVPDGVPILWTVCTFTIETIALAFPMVWIRLRTRSIWPALVLHGTFNAALYLVAEPATPATASSGWFVGEGGLLTSVGTVVAVVATARLWRAGPAELSARPTAIE